MDIFAEIINIDTLNNYRSILEKLKIKTIAIDSSTYRLLNLCDAQNFALVNITKNEVIIFCCLDGKPKYTRRVTKEELKFPDNMLKLIDIKYLFRFIKDTLTIILAIIMQK